MKVDFLEEPELEFGTGRHVDIRFGLMHHGPLDGASPLAPKEIKLGIIGTTETVEGVRTWLDRCRDGIDAKKSNQPNLFPRFPGYGPDTNLRASIVMNSQLEKTILQREFDELCKSKNPAQAVRNAVELFFHELQELKEKNVDVLMCALPMNLLNYMMDAGEAEEKEEKTEGEDDEEDKSSKQKVDFHHLLKARAMTLGKPIQIILPPTYDESKRRKQRRRKEDTKQLQDEATRAWNIYTALYYKAGGTPWRLVRDPSQLTVCYVGVSFYKTLDESRLLTSTAQIFNERGDGIILRGGNARVSKDDRQIHLQQQGAFELLDKALKSYRDEHRNLPARIALYKTSGYNEEELEGFRGALKEHRVDSVDFISMRDSFTRLFRNGRYPPLRGTFLTEDEISHVLYTRGGVDFFSTYPGMYVPRPLGFRCEDAEQTPKFLAHEILSLTKMNWNNTQFDNDEPITVKAARNVGNILKYVGENDPIQARYSFYM